MQNTSNDGFSANIELLMNYLAFFGTIEAALHVVRVIVGNSEIDFYRVNMNVNLIKKDNR